MLLFSGHMVDRPERATPRFPQSKVPAAAAAIAAVLEELGVDEDDLALCGGACGGDLLFAEACLARGARLELRLPFAVERFLETSVRFADADWEQRFHAVRHHPRTTLLLLRPERQQALAPDNPYAANNLWQLDAALSHGAHRLRFLALWNGQPGDGAGGTEHMMQQVRHHAGRVFHIDTRRL